MSETHTEALKEVSKSPLQRLKDRLKSINEQIEGQRMRSKHYRQCSKYAKEKGGDVGFTDEEQERCQYEYRMQSADASLMLTKLHALKANILDQIEKLEGKKAKRGGRRKTRRGRRGRRSRRRQR